MALNRETERDKKNAEALRLREVAIRLIADEALKAEMKVEIGNPVSSFADAWVDIEDIQVRSRDKSKYWAPGSRLSIQVGVNEIGCTRTYPIKSNGLVNTKAILEYIRVLVQRRKDEEVQNRNAAKRRKQDEQMYERLSKLHAGIGCVSVSCEYGRTSIEVKGLSEDQAKNVLALLAPALRPVPEPGEIWQHIKVKVPSRVVSNKGMIKLESLDDKTNLCTIPKREFAENWELVSAAPEVEEP